MNDKVHRSGELIAATTVIECGGVVGVIESELWPQRDDLVRPPGDADGVFRVRGRVPGAAPDNVIVELISHSKERTRRDSKHRVVNDPPLGRIAGLHWKRTAL